MIEHGDRVCDLFWEVNGVLGMQGTKNVKSYSIFRSGEADMVMKLLF